MWLKPIADKVCNKFSKWKGQTLSMVGRLLLIKSVITSSLLHSFDLYRWSVFAFLYGKMYEEFFMDWLDY